LLEAMKDAKEKGGGKKKEGGYWLKKILDESGLTQKKRN